MVVYRGKPAGSKEKGTWSASMKMTVFQICGTEPERRKDDTVAGLKVLYIGIQPVGEDAKNGCIS